MPGARAALWSVRRVSSAPQPKSIVLIKGLASAATMRTFFEIVESGYCNDDVGNRNRGYVFDVTDCFKAGKILLDRGIDGMSGGT